MWTRLVYKMYLLTFFLIQQGFCAFIVMVVCYTQVEFSPRERWRNTPRSFKFNKKKSSHHIKLITTLTFLATIYYVYVTYRKYIVRIQEQRTCSLCKQLLVVFHFVVYVYVYVRVTTFRKGCYYPNHVENTGTLSLL